MKASIREFAIFGGTPSFQEKLHVGRPNVGNRERLLERFNQMLDRRWLSNAGPFVQEFEQKVADLLKVKHCIATCNGTLALELVIRALGLTGEVIVPSFTFVATAHALQWQEITPVFCDIDPVTYCIDPSKVEQHITPRTTGIIGVHLWGRPCDVEALAAVAERRGLKLLFDAAHAFCCSYKGRMVGTFGNAEVLSFHATKFLNTFEGGAVVANDDDLAMKVRLMKNFGFQGYDRVTYIGTNGKMNEMSAAMGLTGLESVDEFVETNMRNYHEYRRSLEGVRGLKVISYNEADQCNYQYIVVEIDDQIASLNRDQLVEILFAENVLARRYFYPGCHRMEPYRSYFPHAGLLLPETERLAARVLSLPTGQSIGSAEISTISRIISLALENGRELADRIGDPTGREHVWTL